MRELVTHAVGGGWGRDSPAEGTEQVAVIRGADFPAVALGDVTEVPVRWEVMKKVPQRSLAGGDIVLEISGGTSDRPTGRTVYVSDRLLRQLDRTAIPASFCRLVRTNRRLANPHYVYWWLQGMYLDGRTWAYQNRSTGIANFQFEHFLDAEQVRLPPLEEQRGIAATFGALDDKIRSNSRQSLLFGDLQSALFLQLVERNDLSSLPFDDVVERLPVKHKHSSKTVAESGRTPVLDQSDSGLLGFHDGSSEYTTDASNPISLFGDHTCTWRLGIGAFDVGPNVIPVTTKLPSGVHAIWMHYALRGAQTFQEYRRHWMEFQIHDIPWASAAVQQAFVDGAIPMLALVSHLEVENRALANLRDQLLPELLSGRIRVPEARETVAEAVG